MGVTAPKNKSVLYASVAAVLLFIFALVGQHSGHAQKLTSAISSAAKTLPVSWPTTKPPEPSWHEVATHHNTDKVNPHSYQDMYDKYLPDFRHKRIKLLEIGLGCNMVGLQTIAPFNFYLLSGVDSLNDNLQSPRSTVPVTLITHG